MTREARSAALLVGVALRAFASASEYWIAWEGDDWPEDQGWTRYWGDAQGVYHGQGAQRTLADGMLTYNSLFDPSVYDVSKISRPGQMDPGPGELFVMEWRLNVEQVVGFADPGVGFDSDDMWALGLYYAYDRIYSESEGLLAIPFAPGGFHDYCLVSPDVRSYDLYIDTVFSHHGTLRQGVFQSRLMWGDSGQGAASVHTWDYFRFGVIRRGDVNCDGVVDFRDINPFVLALTDPPEYQRRFPNCPLIAADCNGDGRVDFRDINAFVPLLRTASSYGSSAEVSAR